MTGQNRTDPAGSPLLFRPDFETVRPDEADIAAEIVETLRGIMETTAADYGRAVRGVHAKSHGILHGELQVLGDLPAELRHGLFSEPRAFPVVLRLSTNPGDLLDDSVSVPRGLALKVVGVEGERLEGSHGHRTQDFVLADAPSFVAPDAAAFLKSLKLLAATTDTPQILKKAASAALRGVEKLIEAVGGESGTVKSMGGHARTHILGSTFHTQVPMLYGPFAAKLSVVPVSAELLSLCDEVIKVFGKADALREAVSDFFESQSGEWDVRVQLMTNRETMPIEDASVVWPEEENPYRTVAKLRVPPQPSWDADRAEGADQSLAFSPWQGLAAHRPLGSIMRMRKASYAMSSAFRSARNGCPIHEPADGNDLPV